MCIDLSRVMMCFAQILAGLDSHVRESTKKDPNTREREEAECLVTLPGSQRPCGIRRQQQKKKKDKLCVNVCSCSL
jgi:hypothetical protein